MKPVGFDARLWHHTGIGRYASSLLSALHETTPLVIWVAPPDESLARVTWPNAEVRLCPARPFSLEEQLFWARELPKVPLALFHAPHFNVPLCCPVPLVVTLHDLIPLRLPGVSPRRLARIYVALMTRLATRKACRVIAVSEHTKQDIRALLKTPETKLGVIPEAADPLFSVALPSDFITQTRAKYGLAGRYVLYTGQWKRYKNLETLIAAFAALPAELADVKLALVGRVDPHATHVGEAIARHALQDRVILTGYLADERELVALYQGAQIFAFPSRYEGFGLPPLEAMAAGVPVITSNATSLPEVVGDAAWLCAPDDVAGWREALRTLLQDEAQRAAAVARGLSRARQFDWSQTARLTRAVYAECLATNS